MDGAGCNSTEEDMLMNKPHVFAVGVCQLTTYWNYECIHATILKNM